MTKATYNFDFSERIPEKELEKIILITRSGFSYDGKLSKNYVNIEKKNNFSILNILIFSTLFLYFPIIMRINILWNSIDNILIITTGKIIDLFPIDEMTSKESVLSMLFFSILSAIVFLLTMIIFANVLFYYHLKTIFRCCEWANKNLEFYKLRIITLLYTKCLTTKF